MKLYPLYSGQTEWLLRLFVESHKAFLLGSPVDQALSANFRKNKQFGSKDRKFYSTAIFGLYRYWGWLNELCGEKPLLALYYAYLFEGKLIAPWWAEQLGQVPLETPLVGLEAKLQFWKTQDPKATLAQLAPPFLPAFEPATLEALSHRPAAWVRVYQQGPVSKKLNEGVIKATQHPRLTDAWEITEGFNDAEFKGQAQVQDLSSQAVARVCNPQPEQDWLDYCAGAGGKSLHLAHLMGRSGTLTLADTRESALKKAHQRTLDAGLSNLKYFLIEADGSDPEEDKNYDGVLVDVPCSGSGTWARAPWLRWQLTIKELLDLEQIQKDILDRAAHKVRPGGTLVYATCSLLDSENSGVTGSFLAANPRFHKEPFESPLTGEMVQGELFILPQDAGANGMYICKMRAAE